MPEWFVHTRHLWRMLALFLAWIGAFLVVRAMLVPEDFGKYGHYRPAAVGDVAALAPVFAGKAACLECHDSVSQDPQASRHARLSCEICHGPLGSHAADITVTPVRPVRQNSLCLGCHLAGVARPAWFKQVSLADHPEGACMDCHPPHAP